MGVRPPAPEWGWAAAWPHCLRPRPSQTGARSRVGDEAGPSEVAYAVTFGLAADLLPAATQFVIGLGDGGDPVAVLPGAGAWRIHYLAASR
jgi:hypothetical protein